jgi:uncharacterized protein with von Willebrand factor type A (vWA) domain
MRILGDDKKNFIDREIAYSPYTIFTDKLDIRFFEEVKENNPVIKGTLEDALDGYPQFEELQQDLFSSLYRYKPHLIKEHQVKASHLLNYHVMGGIMETEKYKELRALTRLDTINSTVGTEILGKEAHKIIKELEEQRKKLQEAMDAQAAADAEEGEGEEGEGGGEGKEDSLGDQKSSKAVESLTLSEAQKRLEEAKKDLKKSMKKKEVHQKINKILEEAKNAVKETSEMIQNWGLSGDDTFTHMPYHDKMEMLKELRNNKKLKKIADMAGRFKRIATQKQREKVKKGMDEIYDLSLGREINRLIPSELMKLRHPVTKKQFYKDMAEGNLLQYELRGKEKKNKGAIIVCIDDSGSMSGTPEI